MTDRNWAGSYGKPIGPHEQLWTRVEKAALTHPRRAAAIGGAVGVVIIYAAIGALPFLFVWPGSYETEVTPTARPTVVVTVVTPSAGPVARTTSTASPVPSPTISRDRAALQAARNDARVPIGVTAAAIVAATAAGFGVHATRKSTAAAVQAVEAADERHRKDLEAAVVRDSVADAQWEQEHFGERYERAAMQLDGGGLSQRIAGAYALARLADQWPAGSQTCVDVLTAYLRSIVRPEQCASEDTELRRAIGSIMAEKLQLADPPKQFEPQPPGAWAHKHLNLRGARLVGLSWCDVYATDLHLDDATLENSVVKGDFADRCTLDKLTFRGESVWDVQSVSPLSRAKVHGSLFLTAYPNDADLIHALHGGLSLEVFHSLHLLLDPVADGGRVFVTSLRGSMGGSISIWSRATRQPFKGSVTIRSLIMEGGNFAVDERLLGDAGIYLATHLPINVVHRLVEDGESVYIPTDRVVQSVEEWQQRFGAHRE